MNAINEPIDAIDEPPHAMNQPINAIDESQNESINRSMQLLNKKCCK